MCKPLMRYYLSDKGNIDMEIRSFEKDTRPDKYKTNIMFGGADVGGKHSLKENIF